MGLACLHLRLSEEVPAGHGVSGLNGCCAHAKGQTQRDDGRAESISSRIWLKRYSMSAGGGELRLRCEDIAALWYS